MGRGSLLSVVSEVPIGFEKQGQRGSGCAVGNAHDEAVDCISPVPRRQAAADVGKGFEVLDRRRLYRLNRVTQLARQKYLLGRSDPPVELGEKRSQ